MHIERMRLLQEYILAEPQNYEQDTYGAQFSYLNRAYDAIMGTASRRLLEGQHLQNGQLKPENPICGTACCLAGTVVAINNPVLYKSFVEGPIAGTPTGTDIRNEAKRWLGLNDCQASTLFSESDSWPEDYRIQYDNANSLQARAQVGADMIDFIIQNADKLPPLGEVCPDFEEAMDYDSEDFDEDFVDSVDDGDC